MRRLMKRLEKYLDRKELMLSTEKTKVIRKRERERRRVKWWKRKKIEEVKKAKKVT